MSAVDSPGKPKARLDGWTLGRQLLFLAALAETGSVVAAATSAGMSREGAYRLRNRRDGALFAAIWDRALEPGSPPLGEVDTRSISDGQLARLLGIHFRRKSGDYASIASIQAETRPR